MTDDILKESLRLDLMEIQKAQQIRIIKRLQDTLINTIYRLYVDPFLQKYVVSINSNSEKSKNITTYQAIRARFDGIEKGQLCQLIIKEYKKEMIEHNFINQYEKTLKQIVAEERVEQPSELKEKTRKKGKVQAAWEAQTWKKIISLLMLANHENPTLETFRDMWNHVYPEHPLPVNKPGRKSKDIYQEDDVEEDGESEEILLQKDNHNSKIVSDNHAKLSYKNLINLKNDQEQTKNIMESQQKQIYRNQNINQGSSMNSQLQNECKQIEKHSICKNSNALSESMQKNYQKINENQQFQLNEDNESENICLECLQNNQCQSITPKKSLISNHLSQSDAYQNAIKDQQNQDILFKSQSLINLETIINNKPSKFIAHSQSNEIQNFKFIADTSNNNIKYSVSSLTSQQINPQTDLNMVCNKIDEDIVSQMNPKTRITEILKEYQKANVNHPNSQENKLNQFSQQGETQSYKQSLQSNNQQQHNNNHLSTICLKQDLSSSDNIIMDSFKQQQSTQKDISEISNTLFPVNLQEFILGSQLNQQPLIEQYFSNKDILYQPQQPMNYLTNSVSFLNNNNHLQLLQQQLAQMVQKNHHNESYSPLLNSFDDQAKDNSTQGCSCCDNNQNSPQHKPTEIQNHVPLKSEKKAQLLHKNPENNKISQQYELSLEDKANELYLNNNRNQIEKQDKSNKNEKNKCSHANNKVNGFQIAKSQQAMNQQYIEKIAQLEAIISQQQEENKKIQESQEQLKVENNLFRNYFQQQIMNQNSLFALLNPKQSTPIQFQTQILQQQQQQSSQQIMQQQQKQNIEQQMINIQNIQSPQHSQQQGQQNYLNSVSNNQYSLGPIDSSILQSLTADQQTLFYPKLNHYQELNSIQ